MAIQLIQRNPSLWKTRDPKLIQKYIIDTILKAKFFTVAAKLETSAHPSSSGRNT